MFRKVSFVEHPPTQNLSKTSVARGIRTQIVRDYPPAARYIEELLPRKEPLVLARWQGQSFVSVHGELLFFSHKADGAVRWLPTMRTLMRYPDMLPRLQVDRGAIRFVLAGANVMCPGLTSPGGALPDAAAAVPAGAVVAVFAEGKENPLAVGVTAMSVADVRAVNKGVAIEALHYLGDGLYTSPRLP